MTASRLACWRVCEYRSSILADIQPAMAFIVDSGTLASPSADRKVCRRSLSRHHTPAVLRHVVHALFHDPIGIGMPILESLALLQKFSLKTEYDEVLALYQKHGDVLLEISTNFPRSEVNYEQSIVGPSVQILAEVYLATGDRKYLEGLRPLLLCLEAFNGQQPDYHLNDIAIRHWDDYWFGKCQLYGDTLPHHWSTITAICFDDIARATSDKRYFERAKRILANNLCLFHGDGSASCASGFPLTINDKPGRFLDPLANDQDWALVYYLMIHSRGSS